MMQQTFSTPKYWSISTSLSNISPACLSTPRGDWQHGSAIRRPSGPRGVDGGKPWPSESATMASESAT